MKKRTFDICYAMSIDKRKCQRTAAEMKCKSWGGFHKGQKLSAATFCTQRSTSERL